jgi:hypothetical protein
MTGFSPEGTVEEIGTNTSKPLDKLLRRIDRTKRNIQEFDEAFPKPSTRKEKAKWRKARRRRRKATRSAEDKSQRVVRDLHYKTAHYLLQRYRQVILPTTSLHQWRKGRKLARCVKRRRQMLRLGAFSTRLMQTATQYFK